jgi:hypothetical protein
VPTVLITLEAESGVLTSPMARANDSMAYGGRYIVTNTQDSGKAKWTFNVPAAGNYYVWCRVLASSDSHDSFFALPQGSSPDVYDMAEGSWGPNWQWTVLNGRAGTGVPLTLDPRIVTLQSGSNMLELDGREVGSKVDKVVVTNDPNYVPTGGNVVTFDDVLPSNPFFDYVETLADNEITGGCGPDVYCPGSGVTRAQMAVFLLKAKHGSNYTPPPATGTVFSDVPANSFAAAWIERLYAEGITTGCGGGRFCPTPVVARAQMAVFLLRASNPAGYAPPPATGMFDDLAITDPFTPWAEELARRGVTAGCGNGNFCPNSPNTRGQMAAFLVRTFGLP